VFLLGIEVLHIPGTGLISSYSLQTTMTTKTRLTTIQQLFLLSLYQASLPLTTFRLHKGLLQMSLAKIGNRLLRGFTSHSHTLPGYEILVFPSPLLIVKKPTTISVAIEIGEDV
jgi:hypothetical protein